jgi:hypothetical protein
MRKLTASTVGLLVFSLLTMPEAPATAQLSDPLRPAAAGVLLPFFSDPGSGFVSVLEVTSPVVAATFTNPLHMVFFTATCVRSGSVGDEFTVNQAKAYISTASPFFLQFNGLAAIARSTNSTDLLPLKFPIHSRVHWIDVKTGRLRELEPIMLDTFLRLDAAASIGACVAGPTTPPLAATPFNGFNNGFCWSPLGSAATFVTPQESASVHASIILICPRSTIQSSTGAGVFPVAAGFPRLVNRDGSFGFLGTSPITGGSSTRLRGEIYDDNELIMRDLDIPCDCLTSRTLASIDAVYSLPPTNLGAHTVPVWYTVLRSTSPPTDPGPGLSPYNSFTGYWNLEVTGSAATLFHRMSTASLDNLTDGTSNALGNR